MITSPVFPTEAEIVRLNTECVNAYRGILPADELLALSDGYNRIAQGVYAAVWSRKHRPDKKPEPYIGHPHWTVVKAAQLEFRPFPCFRTVVGSVLGLFSHDVEEELVITEQHIKNGIHSGFDWVDGYIGPEANIIHMHMTLPGKKPGVSTTEAMREGYYAQIESCPQCAVSRYPQLADLGKDEKGRLSIVLRLWVGLDHLHCASTLEDLNPLARAKKITAIRTHCMKWLRRDLSEYYPAQCRQMLEEFDSALRSAESKG